MDPSSARLTSTAATAATRTYTFKLNARHAFALVADCTTGRITVSGASVSCKGGPRGLVAFCTGQNEQFTAHVSVRQPKKWGVAVYKISPC